MTNKMTIEQEVNELANTQARLPERLLGFCFSPVNDACANGHRRRASRVHGPNRAGASRRNTRRRSDAANMADSSLRSRSSSDSSRSRDHRNSRRTTANNSRYQKRKSPALEPGAEKQRAGRMLRSEQRALSCIESNAC